jgi:hypothetical protein
MDHEDKVALGVAGVSVGVLEAAVLEDFFPQADMANIELRARRTILVFIA